MHGTLHVVGYDHDTDAGQMALRQAEVIERVAWEGLVSQRRGNLLQSFNWAFEGIVHVLRTSGTCGSTSRSPSSCSWSALFFDLTRLEVVALLVAIAFVLIAEMFNTALETRRPLHDRTTRSPRSPRTWPPGRS